MLAFSDFEKIYKIICPHCSHESLYGCLGRLGKTDKFDRIIEERDFELTRCPKCNKEFGKIKFDQIFTKVRIK